MKKTTDYQTFTAKVEELRNSNTYDLSMEEDLSIAIMNLVSIEEHLYFTAQKTKRSAYIDALDEARTIRKELLARLIPNTEGETWCVSKHLLATTMRLIEVGTKLHASGEHEKAQTTFQQAYKLYNLFWGLRLNLLDTDMARTTIEEDKAPMSYEGIMDKLVDCCKE